jgi:hypothetical protein
MPQGAAVAVDQPRLHFRAVQAAEVEDILHLREERLHLLDRVTLEETASPIIIILVQVVVEGLQRQEIRPQMQMVQKVETELITLEQFTRVVAVEHQVSVLEMVARRVRVALRLVNQVLQARPIAVVVRVAEANIIQAVTAEAALS